MSELELCSIPFLLVHIPPFLAVTDVRQLCARLHPVQLIRTVNLPPHCGDPTEILDIIVATNRCEATIVALALEGMFLEGEEAALHAVLGLLYNDEGVPQRLSASPAPPFRKLSHIVVTVTADLLDFVSRVLEVTFPANVHENLGSQGSRVFTEVVLPSRSAALWSEEHLALY